MSVPLRVGVRARGWLGRLRGVLTGPDDQLPPYWWIPALVYPTVLALTDTMVAHRPPAQRSAWLSDATTSVANLVDHPLRALLLSGLVAGGRPEGYVLMSLAGLGVLGAAVGPWRCTALALAAHVGGTLCSEGIVALRILRGGLPVSSAYLVDVGPSYVVVGVLAAGVVAGRGGGLVLCAAGLAVLGTTLFDGLPDLDVAAVGHLYALTCGAVLGGLLAPRAARFGRAPGG